MELKKSKVVTTKVPIKMLIGIMKQQKYISFANKKRLKGENGNGT